MSQRKALVTGITGQCGSILAKYLLDKDYNVFGLERRKSVNNHDNIEEIKKDITLLEGDITDSTSINKIIKEFKFDCVFNLCAQSHVKVSFDQPELTEDVNYKGVLYLLEAIKNNSSHTRMLQSSSSEMFGNGPYPQNENTPLCAVSPYGVSKIAAHNLVQIYHQSYKLRCASTICFNMESKKRGKTFATRKITEGVKALYKHYEEYGAFNKSDCPVLELGFLDSYRDWSHAQDSIRAMYMVCYQDMFFKGIHNSIWKSYCIGTGKAYKIRDFLVKALMCQFNLKEFNDRFYFEGTGIDEIVKDKVYENVVVKINEKFFRPNELNTLVCDASLIKRELGWEPYYTIDDIVKEMITGILPVKGENK